MAAEKQVEEKGMWKSGNARRGRTGWTFGQFVIKLKIPSAEEADERVTNRRDRNGSPTGRRHVTTDKRRTGVYPMPLLRAARYLTSTLFFSLSSSSLPLPFHDHPRSLDFPGGRWAPPCKKFVRTIQHRRGPIRDTRAGIEAGIISINSPILTL